jgi:hypothetical protein
MNKNIKLAVAGAVLALSATANAGIIIPAGDWTIDINGNVNGFANQTNIDKDTGATGSAIAVAPDSGRTAAKSIQTGLLPAWIGFTGKTRQNDLDVEFTISLQPGISSNDITGDSATGVGGGLNVGDRTRASVLNRQTYLSFGDKSWGSIKLGKDIGIYASDAILNDMTLLGVGAGAGSSSTLNSTAGGIGSGYQYAAWKGQIAYTTPNWSGFQATVGITNPEQMAQVDTYQSQYGVEYKASYSFNLNDVAGKVWHSGATYDVKTVAASGTRVSAYDIGANINIGGLGLTGYVYDGKGNGMTFLGFQGTNATGTRRDGDGGYVQATYVLPFKTKIGAAWGRSRLDGITGDAALTAADSIAKEQDRWTVGAYHPLTKHLNLVAEYSDIKLEGQNGNKNEYGTASLGAILFF